jgi:glycosyltransferase involved in cell wall biosynthesis
MKVLHWNISKQSHPMYALKKYEDQLFRNLKILRKDWEFERIYRKDNKFLGNTITSWFQYPSYDADIVHATAQTVAPAIYLKNARNFIVTVHDLAPLVYSNEINNLSLYLQWLFTPNALKKSKHIIAISEFTKKEIVRILGINKERISVIYQGVDSDIYYPMNKMESKKALGLNLEEQHILVISSNLIHKRMYLTQKIFKQIHFKRKDIKLIKAGYAESLQGEGIINMGWVSEENMPLLYNASDMLLHTSEYEGFGLPILEAMACGIPIISSNRAAIPEFASSQLLLNSENIHDENLKKDLSLKGSKAAKPYSWRKTALDTANLYQKIIDE